METPSLAGPLLSRSSPSGLRATQGASLLKTCGGTLKVSAPSLNSIAFQTRIWSSASNGVFLISLRVGHGVALPHYVNVFDLQGALCEHFEVYVDIRRRNCFRCGGPGHLGAFCKASCLAPEATPTLWSSLIYAGPVLASDAVAALATGDQSSSPAAEAAVTSPASDAVAASVAGDGMASTAASASPTVVVAAAPSAAAAPVAAPTVYVTSASTPAASTAPSAAEDAASINLAAAVVAASDTIVTAPVADVRAAVPLHDRSGSASSASDMSGAEEEGSAAGGFSLPRRRRRRSTQLGSPGSMSPNKKTHKKEPG